MKLLILAKDIQIKEIGNEKMFEEVFLAEAEPL